MARARPPAHDACGSDEEDEDVEDEIHRLEDEYAHTEERVRNMEEVIRALKATQAELLEEDEDEEEIGAAAASGASSPRFGAESPIAGDDASARGRGRDAAAAADFAARLAELRQCRESVSPVVPHGLRQPPGSWERRAAGSATPSVCSSSGISARSRRTAQEEGRRHAGLGRREQEEPGTALGELRAELLRREPSLAGAWRRRLDPGASMRLTQAQLFEALRPMGITGNLKAIWQELDAAGSGAVTLCDLDWATAEALGKFCGRLSRRCGGVREAAAKLGVRGARRLRHADFCRRVCSRRLAEGFQEADALFRMLCSGGRDSRPCVTAAEFDWLAALAETLPRAAERRVPPGALAQAEESDGSCLASEASCAGSGSDSELSVDCSEAAGSIGSAAPRRRRRGGAETVFEKLYREAAAQAAAAAARSRAPEAPRMPEAQAEALVDRLYGEASKLQERRSCAVEDYLRFARDMANPESRHDPEVFQRLVQPRQRPEAPAPAPASAPPEKGEQCRQRLYADAYQRVQRKTHRVATAMEQQECRLDAMLPKGTARTTTFERLHAEEEARRERKKLRAEVAEREKLAKEAAERRPARRRPPDAAAFARLYNEAAYREALLEEKRRQKLADEERELRAGMQHGALQGGDRRNSEGARPPARAAVGGAANTLPGSPGDGDPLPCFRPEPPWEGPGAAPSAARQPLRPARGPGPAAASKEPTAHDPPAAPAAAAPAAAQPDAGDHGAAAPPAASALLAGAGTLHGAAPPAAAAAEPEASAPPAAGSAYGGSAAASPPGAAGRAPAAPSGYAAWKERAALAGSPSGPPTSPPGAAAPGGGEAAPAAGPPPGAAEPPQRAPPEPSAAGGGGYAAWKARSVTPPRGGAAQKVRAVTPPRGSTAQKGPTASVDQKRSSLPARAQEAAAAGQGAHRRSLTPVQAKERAAAVRARQEQALKKHLDAAAKADAAPGDDAAEEPLPASSTWRERREWRRRMEEPVRVAWGSGLGEDSRPGWAA